MNIHDKVKIIIKEMNGKLIEREKIIPIVLLSLFSEQHMLLLGPPGVGKTYLIELITNFAKDLKYFEYLITNSTKLDELFGTSIIDDSNNVQYNIENSMLDSHICFIDELFKAPSSLLNSLLGITHSSRSFFQRGRGKLKSPMKSMFAASNELPDNDNVDAFDDRILFRFWVDEISDPENFKRFSKREFDRSKIFSVSIDKNDFTHVKSEAQNVFIHDNFVSIYSEIRTKLTTEKVRISDRKLQSSLDIFQTSAFLNERDYIDLSELFLLLDIAWKHYDDIDRVKRVVFDIVFGNPSEVLEVLVNNKQESKKLLSTLRSTNANALKYTFNYYGTNAEVSFTNTRNDFIKISEELKIVKDNYNRLKDNYLFAKEMEAKIKNNIFLPNYKNHIYNDADDTICAYKKVSKTEIFDLSENVDLVFNNLIKWLNDTETLYDYNNIQITKNKR